MKKYPLADCVEDCHRFMSGQMEMRNITSRLDNYKEVYEKLQEVKQLVTPELRHRGSSYDWSGGNCPNKWQRQFIAQTYPIYREILHFFACQKKDNDWNVYRSETLTCQEGGPLIQIKDLKNEKK